MKLLKSTSTGKLLTEATAAASLLCDVMLPIGPQLAALAVAPADAPALEGGMRTVDDDDRCGSAGKVTSTKCAKSL